MPRLSLPCCLLIALAGCGDRNEAADIRDEIRGDDYRNTYARAPGWEDDRQPSEGGPHGGFVNIYVYNPVNDCNAGYIFCSNLTYASFRHVCREGSF